MLDEVDIAIWKVLVETYIDKPPERIVGVFNWGVASDTNNLLAERMVRIAGDMPGTLVVAQNAFNVGPLLDLTGSEPEIRLDGPVLADKSVIFQVPHRSDRYYTTPDFTHTLLDMSKGFRVDKEGDDPRMGHTHVRVLAAELQRSEIEKIATKGGVAVHCETLEAAEVRIDDHWWTLRPVYRLKRVGRPFIGLAPHRFSSGPSRPAEIWHSQDGEVVRTIGPDS